MRPVDAMTHVEVEAELTRSGVVLTTTARALALKWLRHDCQELRYRAALEEIKQCVDEDLTSNLDKVLNIRDVLARIGSVHQAEAAPQGKDSPFQQLKDDLAGIARTLQQLSDDPLRLQKLAGRIFMVLACTEKAMWTDEWLALCREDPALEGLSGPLFTEALGCIESHGLASLGSNGWIPNRDLLARVAEVIDKPKIPTLDTPTLKRHGSRFLVMCQEDGFWFQVDLCRHQIECGSYDADGTCKMYAYPRRMAFGDIDPIYPSHEDAKIILQAWLEMGRW